MWLIDNPLTMAGCLMIENYHVRRITVSNLLYIVLLFGRFTQFQK